MSNEPFAVSTYVSVWQLRADGWAWLEGATKRLLEMDPQHGDQDTLVRDVGSLLDLLEPIERYWAFPGRREFARLRRLLEHGERVCVLGVSRATADMEATHGRSGRGR